MALHRPYYLADYTLVCSSTPLFIAGKNFFSVTVVQL